MDVPTDYRFLDVLLRAADDPEVGLGEYAQGVKVGPGTRMPRLPALYKPQKKWRLPSQVDPLDYLEYAPDRYEHEQVSMWRSSWFSLEITREDFPWVFEKVDRPSLIISTLEALALLVALKIKFGQEPDPNDMRVLIVPSLTDNRGNGAALNKLMSTGFPSSAVLMELAEGDC